MSVTAFGGCFLALMFCILLFRRRWLVPLLCVSAVMQSPSVLDLQWNQTALGITPFVVVATAMALDLLRVRLGMGGQGTSANLGEVAHDVRRVAHGWLLLAALSVAGAMLLPWLFSGVEVYAPLDKGGTHTAPASLRWSISNLAQVINVLLALAAGAWLWQHRHSLDLPRAMLRGCVVALVLSAMVGLQQRLGWNGLLPLWEGFWASNPTYDQNYRSWAGPIPRVSWPFVEASYASAWFAAALGGFLAMFVADVRRDMALLGLMVAVFALGNTLGATGLLATAAYSALLLLAVAVTAVRRPRVRSGIAYRGLLLALVFSCLSLAVVLILRHQLLLDEAQLAVGNVLTGRNQTLASDIRPHANHHTLALLRETWGLGVGMGSHRGSSYLANLAGTGGVAGLLLFLFVAGLHMRALLKRAVQRPEPASVFFLGATMAGLLAVSIAIPDQNWPVLQLLLLGGFACLVAPSRAEPVVKPLP